MSSGICRRARERSRARSFCLPPPPGDPSTWDFDRELYAEELPGWIEQWKINAYWIWGAEHGDEACRCQISQDICWFMDNPQHPMPQALQDYQYRAYERMAQGASPASVFPTTANKLRTDRVRRMGIFAEVVTAWRQGAKTLTAAKEHVAKKRMGDKWGKNAGADEKELSRVDSAYKEELAVFNKRRQSVTQTLDSMLKE